MTFKKILGKTAVHVALIIMALVTLIPIAYTFTVSLQGSITMVSGDLRLIPENPSFANYRTMLFEKPFFKWLGNSAILSAASVVFALMVAIPAAYAYSRYKFFGKRATLFLFLLLNAFPSVLTMVAIYRLFRILHLLNSYAGLIIVYTGIMIIFGIWNLKGYFDTLPVSLDEAALIDGASRWTILWRIALPLAMPSIIVTGVLIFITSWNEYIYAVIFLQDMEKFTLAAGLYSIQGTEYTTNWPVFSAGSLLITLPVLIVFFIVQRFMVSGLQTGGVKY